MASEIKAMRSCYIVKDELLDSAVAAMQEHDEVSDDIHTAEWGRDGFSIVYPESGNAFGGHVGPDWGNAVADFMDKFCEVGSYATFRDADSEWGYCMYEKRDYGVFECFRNHALYDFYFDLMEHDAAGEDIPSATITLKGDTLRWFANSLRSMHKCYADDDDGSAEDGDDTARSIAERLEEVLDEAL